MKVTDKTGPVVGAVTVTAEDELMLMTSSGQSIRIRVAEIRETGRNAQGVKLLTLREGEKLRTSRSSSRMARTPKAPRPWPGDELAEDSADDGAGEDDGGSIGDEGGDDAATEAGEP